MSTGPAQDNRRRCFFCDELAGMTEEHAWPQWLHEGVDMPPERHVTKSGFTRTGQSTYEEHQTTVVSRKGSVLKLRPRVVCLDCNTGWMNRQLEQPVKPLLQRLWAKDNPPAPTSLSPDESALLAVWAVKTLWVHALAQQAMDTPEPMVTPDMRTHVMTQATPPPHSYVAVARYAGTKNFDATVATAGITHRDASWDAEEVRHAMYGTLTFEGLCLYVMTVDGPGTAQADFSPDYWRTLWPVDSTVQWPPPQTLDDPRLESVKLAHLRAGTIAPDATVSRNPGVVRIKKN